MSTYRIENGFKFNPANWAGLDPMERKACARFAAARERELNTFTTVAYKCHGGPFDGHTLEMIDRSESTAPMTVGGWVGQYALQPDPAFKPDPKNPQITPCMLLTWIGNTCASAVNTHGTSTSEKPQGEVTQGGFTQLSDLLAELSEDPEEREFSSPIGPRASYAIGGTVFTIAATGEAVDRLRTRILKSKKWFSDKMLSAKRRDKPAMTAHEIAAIDAQLSTQQDGASEAAAEQKIVAVAMASEVRDFIDAIEQQHTRANNRSAWVNTHTLRHEVTAALDISAGDFERLHQLIDAGHVSQCRVHAMADSAHDAGLIDAALCALIKRHATAAPAAPATNDTTPGIDAPDAEIDAWAAGMVAQVVALPETEAAAAAAAADVEAEAVAPALAVAGPAQDDPGLPQLSVGTAQGATSAAGTGWGGSPIQISNGGTAGGGGGRPVNFETEPLEPSQDGMPHRCPSGLKQKVDGKSGNWSAELYLNGAGEFVLMFASLTDGLQWTQHATAGERIRALQALAREADHVAPTPPAAPAQPAEDAPEAEQAPAFQRVRPVHADLRAILTEGATPADLVGMGVLYKGDMANAQGHGAIVQAVADVVHGVVVAVTLDDGRHISHINGREFAERSGGRYQLDCKYHGAPYLAELAAARAMLTAADTSKAQTQAESYKADKARFLAEFPQLETAGKNQAGKLAARNMRVLLKAAFPGVKFSVTSDYNSARISWTDGPAISAVDSVVARFDIGASDYQTDYFYTVSSAWSDLFGGVQYLTTTRQLSAATVSPVLLALYGAGGPTFEQWQAGKSWADVPHGNGQYSNYYGNGWDWLSHVRRVANGQAD